MVTVTTRFVAAALLSVFLTHCDRNIDQQKQAVDGVYRLREEFNKGECQAFYAHTETRSEESRQEWSDGCERMKKDLGSWMSFSHATTTALSSPSARPQAVLATGLAVFANGDHLESYWLESYWYLKDPGPELYFLYVEGGGKQFALPHLPKPRPSPRDLPSDRQSG
jgi:hypothetical protein